MTNPDPSSPSAKRYQEMLRSAADEQTAAQPAVGVAHRLRILDRLVVGTSAPDDVLDMVSSALDELISALEPHSEQSRFEQARRLSSEGTFANHPMVGLANPCAPPIRVDIDGGRLIGHVNFGTPQEGPTGFAYGGYIAAGFDAALLMAAGINGVGGPTRSIAVRYRRPTPLNTALRYEAEVTGVEERWVVVEGALLAGDTVCAEGRAEVAQSRLRP